MVILLSEELTFKHQIVRNEEDVIKIFSGRDDVIKIFSGSYYSIEVVDIRWYKNDKPSRKGIRLNKKEAKILLSVLEEILGD